MATTNTPAVDILLREGICEIVVDVATVDLRPIRSGDFAFRSGGVAVERRCCDWRVKVPVRAPEPSILMI